MRAAFFFIFRFRKIKRKVTIPPPPITRSVCCDPEKFYSKYKVIHENWTLLDPNLFRLGGGGI